MYQCHRTPRPGIADCRAACGGSAKSRVCSSVSRRGPRCTNYVARRDYTVRVTKSAKNEGITLIRENDKGFKTAHLRAAASMCVLAVILILSSPLLVLLDVPNPECERSALAEARKHLVLDLLREKDAQPTRHRVDVAHAVLEEGT